MIEQLTHFDANGQAIMVDVTEKRETSRTAVAKGKIRVSPDTMKAIREKTLPRAMCWAWRVLQASWLSSVPAT